MNDGRAAGSVATWATPECPFEIAYVPQVLDDIRLAVVDAFFSLPRGGAEIGGILLGRYSGGHLVITGYDALECEHAYGPSFQLSPNDHNRLAELLSAPRGTGECVVGWYHSHTRSEVFLSAADVEIHARYFREPWQVAMVMKPSTFNPARCGFFFREADGTIHTSESYREFEVETGAVLPAPVRPDKLEQAGWKTPGEPPAPAREDAPPRQSIRTIDVTVPPDEPPAPPSPLEPVRDTIVPLAPVEEAPPIEARPAEPPVAPTEARELFASLGETGGRRPLAWLFWLMAAGFTVTAAYLTRDKWMGSPQRPAAETSISRKSPAPKASLAPAQVPPRAPAPTPAAPPATPPRETPAAAAPPSPISVALALNDSNGQLQIRWDRNSPVVLQGQSGTLAIGDGGSKPQVTLTPAQLRAGTFHYARQTERVEVQLTVEDSTGKRSVETASFLGKLPDRKSAEAQLVRQRDDLAKETARLRAELAAQTERARKAERALADTKSQMKLDQQRRRMTNQAPEP